MAMPGAIFGYFDSLQTSFTINELAAIRLSLACFAVLLLLAGWERARDQSGWTVPSVFLVLALGCGLAMLALHAL